MPNKVYFEYSNWTEYLCLIIGTFLIILGILKDGSIAFYSIAFFGILILIIDLSKIFWFKNYVKYNKTRVYIKIKRWIGFTIRYDEVSSIKNFKYFFVITKNNGDHIMFSTRQMHYSDVKKINELLLEKINANKLLK